MCKMIHRSLTAPFHGAAGSGGFTLNQIGRNDRVPEMDFFYEIRGSLDTTALKKVAAEVAPRLAAAPGSEPERAAAALALQGGNVRTGFMNGSIDLLFRRDGRFYFADWKTDTIDDYSSKSLWERMFSESYILQCLIYSLVLDLYLKKRLKGYDFGRHFGGGYYVFVRGLQTDGGKGLLHIPVGRDVIGRLKSCIQEINQENGEGAR
jgi:exodeoxyribonuclease V beta subunit